MTLFFVRFAVANRQLHKRQHVMHRVQYHGAIFKGPDPGHCDLLFLIFLSIKKIKSTACRKSC